jgi:predicted Zn-dependent protease
MAKVTKHRLVFTGIILYLVLFLTDIPALAISIEDERKVGEQFVESVKQYLVEDDFVNDYINKLGHFLTESLETRHFPYNFYIIDEKDLNAFAVPGGHIFFFTGLIEAMDEVDELASVMCHELAHVYYRHYSHRIEQAKNINIASMAGFLAGILVGGEAAEAIIAGTMAAGQQKLLSYSRNDERQADLAGFEYCLKSGFDPRAFKSALNKLQQGLWGINKIPPYLLTHPLGAERIANIDAMLASPVNPSIKKETIYFRKTYPLFRTIIKSGYWDDKSAEKYYTNELENDPESPLAHLGMAIVLEKKADYAKAIEHFKLAAGKLSEPLLVLRYLSETYQLNGQDAEAMDILKGILEKNAHDKPALFFLANSYQNLEEYSKAEEIYEKLKYMDPVKDEVFYNLGLSYGRENKLGPAHYNFGLYFKRLKKWEKAWFHFKKAEEEAKGDPELMGRIAKAMEEMEQGIRPPRPGGPDERFNLYNPSPNYH